jgi:dolichol kinase
MLKRVAYALAAGGLFAWFILDKPLAGAALLLVAFADGLASLFISRRAASQKTYMEKE